MPKINMSQIERPTPAPEGSYLGFIREAKVGESKKGDWQVKLKFSFLPSDAEEFEGIKNGSMYLTYKEDGSLDWVFERFFKATECEVPEDEDFDLEDIDYEGLIARVEVEIIDGDGDQQFNTISGVSRVDDVERAHVLEVMQSLAQG